MSSSHAQSTLGRGSAHAVPWVTFVLLVACVVAYGVTQLAAREAQRQAEAELHTAIEYLISHAYLDPGPILSERIDPSFIEQKRNLENMARIRRGTPPIPKRVQLRHQEHLDNLIEQAFAGASKLPAQRWGFRATDFDLVTLFTHPFFHTGGMHMMGALFLLLLLGFQLEPTWGSGSFLVMVICAGAVSAVTFGLGNPGFNPPLVGMSGTVAALLGAFMIRCRSIWHLPVYPFLLIGGAVFLFVPVRWGFEWSIAGGLEQATLLVEHRGASFWSFAGGFAFGILADGAIALLASVSAAADDDSDGTAKFVASPEFQKAINARAAGNLTEAHAVLSSIVRSNHAEREALILMWDVALELGNPAEASEAMLRAIREDVKCNDLDAAVEHWFDLSNRGLSADAEPALLIRMAVALQQREQSFAAVNALQQALARSDGSNEAVIASRVARVSRDLDHETARNAAWQALGSMDLDLEERQALERLLGDIGPGIDIGGFMPTNPDHAVEVEFGNDTLDFVDETAIPEPRPNQPQVWVDPALVEDSGEVELQNVVHSEESQQQVAESGDDFRLEPIELELVNRTARSVAVTPLSLDPEGLLVEVANGSKKRVAFEKIEAIAVAAVGGLGPKAVVVIDLVMNWESASGEPLKILRMRGDRFNPSALAPQAENPLDALRLFTRALLYKCANIGLPDPQSVAGMPFASYDDLAGYERAVLGLTE